MIEYNVRNNVQTSDDEIRINFGGYKEYLKHNEDGVFSVYDP